MSRARSNAISSKSPPVWGGGGKVTPSGSGPSRPLIGMQRAIGNQATIQSMADKPPETIGYDETSTSNGGSSEPIPYSAVPEPEAIAYNNVYDEIEQEAVESEEASSGGSMDASEPAYNNVYDEIEQESEEASGGGSEEPYNNVVYDEIPEEPAYNNVYDEIEEQSEEASGGGSTPDGYNTYTIATSNDEEPAYNNVYDEIEEQSEEASSGGASSGIDAYTAPTSGMFGGNMARNTAAAPAPKPKPTAPYTNENGFEMKPMNPGMEAFDTNVQRKGVAFAPMQSTTHYMRDEEQRKDYARGFNEQGLMTNASSGEALNTIGALQAPAHGSKPDRHIFTMDGEGQFHSADAVRETRTRGAQAAAEGLDTQERFHHSSFNAGEAVAGAGEMQVRDGQVELVSDTSGHYFPGSKQMMQTVQQLERNNVSMEKLGVEFNGKGRGENLQASALELLGYANHSPETAETQMREMHGKKDNVLGELRDAADGLDENSNLTPSEVMKQQKANKQAPMQRSGVNNQPTYYYSE